jgi:hypothetical protein
MGNFIIWHETTEPPKGKHNDRHEHCKGLREADLAEECPAEA